VNQQIQLQPQVAPATVQAMWVQYITPIIVGLIFVVFLAGMIRDLFKGEEVKLPPEELALIKK